MRTLGLLHRRAVGSLVLASLLLVASTAWAQAEPALFLLDGRNVAPLDEEARVDYFTVDFFDEGKRKTLGADWHLGLGLGSGLVDGEAAGPDGPTAVPRLSFDLGGRTLESFSLEAASAMGLPLVFGNGATILVPDGVHTQEAQLVVGDEPGVQLHLRQRADHGERPGATAQRIDLGPAPFLDETLDATLRPFMMFAPDLGFSLSASYGLRVTAYDTDVAPIERSVSHTVGAGFGMCFPDLFGSTPCLDIMRVLFQHADLEPVGDPLPSPAAMPLIRGHESFSMRVGFLDGAFFDNIRFFGYIAPTWVWDADQCTFDDDLACKGNHQFRRAGWSMNGAFGYSHAIDEWGWGLAFENGVGHSPDGHLLGSQMRLEAAARYAQDADTPWRAGATIALSNFDELFCTSCLEQGELMPFEPADIKDNSLTRFNVTVEAKRALWEAFSVGARYDACYGGLLAPGTWAIDDDRRGARHEVLATVDWRPDLSLDAADAAPPRDRCGDGLVGGAEGCDDGNDQAGDGCFRCAVEPMFCGQNGAVLWTCTGYQPSQCTRVDCGQNPTHPQCPRRQVTLAVRRIGRTVGTHDGGGPDRVGNVLAGVDCSCLPSPLSAADCTPSCTGSAPLCAESDSIVRPGANAEVARWQGTCAGSGDDDPTRCMRDGATDTAAIADLKAKTPSGTRVHLVFEGMSAAARVLAVDDAPGNEALVVALATNGPATSGPTALAWGGGQTLLWLNADGVLMVARELRAADLQLLDVALQDDGALYVTGMFSGTLSIAANSGADVVVIGDEGGVAGGTPEFFVAAFDAAAELRWAHPLRQAGSTAQMARVATDADGAVVAATRWSGDAPQTQVVRFDAAGNLLSMQRTSGVQAWVSDLWLDPADSGHVVVVLTDGTRTWLAEGDASSPELSLAQAFDAAAQTMVGASGQQRLVGAWGWRALSSDDQELGGVTFQRPLSDGVTALDPGTGDIAVAWQGVTSVPGLTLPSASVALVSSAGTQRWVETWDLSQAQTFDVAHLALWRDDAIVVGTFTGNVATGDATVASSGAALFVARLPR